jgi:hypothetical protein
LNEAEQQAMIAKCTAFDMSLHKERHFAGGVALLCAEAKD